MVKYLCLVYRDELAWNALPPAEYAQLIDDILSYRQELRNEGRLVTADAVQSAKTAVKIQPGPTGPVVTDGPFAETKEQLGGFYVIEAKDREEAIAIVSNIPSSRLATIEVWPLKDLAALQEARLATTTTSR
jgi:hypothetical protein